MVRIHLVTLFDHFTHYELEENMTLVQQLGELLSASHRGPAWHGPSLVEILDGVDAARAAARPIANGHTIWEIALHIAAWEGVVVRRLAGESVAEPPEGDFPAISDTSEHAWAASRAHIDKTHQSLLASVAELADADLTTPPPNNPTPRFTAITGVLQHLIYHSGQIALLKRAS